MNKPLQNIDSTQEDKSGKNGLQRMGLFVKRVLLTSLALILLSFLLFQIPWVQNWAAGKATTYLSKELKTTVSIDRLKIGFFRELVLENFYLEDQKGDSLISSGQVKVDLKRGLFSLLGRSLKIEEVTLQNARIFIRRDSGEYFNNLQFLVDYFKKNPAATTATTPDTLPPSDNFIPENKRKPFELEVSGINLDNVLFVRRDKVRGQTLSIYTGSGNIRFNSFNLAEKRIDIAELNLGNPFVKIEDYPSYPLPKPTESKPVKSQPVKSQPLAVETPAPTDGALPSPPPEPAKLLLTIENFLLTDGIFSLHNYRKEPVKQTSPETLDFHHLEVYDINANFKNFSYSDWEFKGAVEHLSFQDSSGFVLDTLSAKDVLINSRRVALKGLELITPFSHLRDTLIFKYRQFPDFKQFVNRVLLEVHFNRSFIALKDIMVFAPKLEDNEFFKQNADETFAIDGLVSGKINSLRGKNLSFSLPNRASLKGNFNSRNLAVKDEQVLNLNLERLQTDVKTLRQLIPGFNPPANYDKLGRLDFSGTFFGFFVDFVAHGNLKSDLGSAEMDMQMITKEGRDKAQYSGSLSLMDFDLGRWADNPNFGKITFTSRVKEGYGLRLNNANAKLEANIDSLQFRNYRYKNIAINGQLNQNLFDGKLNIQDNNINLAFEGQIDFTDSIPVFNFKTKVNRLALLPLHISKKDLQLAGIVDLKLQNKSFSNIQGQANVFDFNIIRNQKDTFRIDSILITSLTNPSGRKVFEVHSEVLESKISGDFNIAEIPESFLQFVERNYPAFAGRLNLHSSGKSLDSSRFDFKVHILDSKNLTQFIAPNFGKLDDVVVKGRFNSYIDSVFLDFDIPGIRVGKVELTDVVLIANMEKSESNLDLGIFKTNINNKQELSPIALMGLINKDTVEFAITSLNFTNILDNLNLNGKFFIQSDGFYQVRFFPSNLVLMNENWQIDADNYIRFGDKSVETQDFVLTNKNQKIRLKSITDVGLEFSIQNINLDIVNKVWYYDKLNFQGAANLTARVNNLFEFSGLSTSLLIDTLLINGDDMGGLRLDAATKTLHDPLEAYLSITKEAQQLTAEGIYALPMYKYSKNQKAKLEPNYFNFDLSLTNYPIKILEYFIGAISKTEGLVDGNVNFHGLPSKPEIKGTAHAREVATTINVLQTTYRIPEGDVVIDNYHFNTTGTKIYDELGNTATANGGLIHNHLKNVELKVKIQTDGPEFLALNTTEKDNSFFYGKALGHGSIDFSGPLKQAEAYVDAEVGKGTEIVIPITSSQESSTAVRFITFPKLEEVNESGNSPVEVKGLNLEMDLKLNDQADMKLIFDKQWGDVIEGSGEGNVRITMDRNKDFQMYGNYSIAQGEYLFTLMNLFVNKPFDLEQGGTIVWSGDPYNADININAIYKGLTTNVSNFIQEYIASAPNDIRALARTPTNVILKMELQGSLLRPAINFDIDFPNLPTELKSYTDSKLRTVKQDQNELNRQVFGLLVMGQFLPSDYTFAPGDIGINTLSEMIANQLSIYLTELVSEWISEDGIISGIDFDISYNKYQAGNINGDGTTPDRTGNELQGRLKVTVSDRLSVIAGGNFEIGNGSRVSGGGASYDNALVAGEFTLEYVLTEDRKLKIRAYNTTEPDIAGGRRNKYGFGLSFRKEFDSLKELFESQKKQKKKAKRAEKAGKTIKEGKVVKVKDPT